MSIKNIKDIHKENKKLIYKYGLEVGDKLQLIKKEKIISCTLPLVSVKNGDVFTISHIHSLYGWVLFKETEQLPQDVKTIINGFIKIENLKGGINK